MKKNIPKISGTRKYPLRYIYFYLTAGCNLNCRHCWIRPTLKTGINSSAVLDFDLFRSIIKQAKEIGLLSVKLTGGEPLSHPQIKNILKFIQAENLQLMVETNGTLCTSTIAREIAKCPRHDISVSLDGKDALTHENIRGVKGCFESAKEGIRNLVREGIRPQIIMSLMPENVSQIVDVAHLAKSLGAKSLKLNIVQPSGRGREMHDAEETLDINTLVSLGKWIEKRLGPLMPLRIMYSHPPAFRCLREIFMPRANCNILAVLGVLADGKYALCGIGATIPEFIFGYAGIDSLKDVWNNTSLLQEIREGLPYRLEGICRDCIMRGVICPGYCLAQNYNVSKNIWAPFWYCQEAYKQGLFPKNRLISHLSGKS